MAINDYLSAQEKGAKLNDTLIHKVMEAYVSVGNSLMTADGIVDTDKLKDKDARQNASSGLYNVLKSFTLEHFGASTTDADRIESLVFGLFGMNQQAIKKYFDDSEEKADFSSFFKYINNNQNAAFSYFLGQNANGRPISKLSIDDAPEVVKHTKTESRVDPNKLDVNHMAELLNQFKEDGMIVDSFLKGKDYAIKKIDIEEDRPTVH